MGMGLIAIAVAAAQSSRKQTLAPHELNHSDAPPPIEWDTPALPDSVIKFDTAEERELRLVVVAKGLEQPWSVAFLGDGAMLITERPGRVRLIHNGHLASSPIAGVPTVQTGGPRGLQGLMDVALHPRFAENAWVYLAYHKPTEDGGGETVLARGTWTGNALVDVRDIFRSGAIEPRHRGLRSDAMACCT